MKKNIFILATYLISISLGITSSILIAENLPIDAKDIIIQEGDLVITRTEVLLMLQEMNWAQKTKLLKDQDKFKALLLNYFSLKKQERAALEKKLDALELVKWKLKKQKAQLLAAELIKDYKNNLNIPKSIEAIAQDYYNAHPEKYNIDERVNVSHILLTLEKGASETKRKEIFDKANMIIKEIKDGLNFEHAAKKYSDDKGSASNGGNINFFKRGQMVPPFENAAFSMEKIGEISLPIKSRFGYHIIKLTGRIKPSIQPFDEIKHKLIKKGINDYLQQKTDEYLSTFSANKKTIVFLPALQKILKDENKNLIDPFKNMKTK